MAVERPSDDVRERALSAEQEVFDRIDELLYEAGFRGNMSVRVRAHPGTVTDPTRPDTHTRYTYTLTVTVKRPGYATGVTESVARAALHKRVCSIVGEEAQVIIDVRAPRDPAREQRGRRRGPSRSFEVRRAKQLAFLSDVALRLWDEREAPDTPTRVHVSISDDGLEVRIGDTLLDERAREPFDALRRADPQLFGAIASGKRHLTWHPNGSLTLQSSEIGARPTSDAGITGTQLRDNIKLELYPKARHAILATLPAIGTVADERDSRVALLAQVVARQVRRALDNIERLNKTTQEGERQRRGKARARTNMLGVTTLYMRLQTLGIITDTGEVDQETVRAHLRAYLRSGSDAKNNFIIALHNIGFRKATRERSFPRAEEHLRALCDGLPREHDEAKPQHSDRLLRGAHPDRGGDYPGPHEPIPTGRRMVTNEFASFLRDIAALRRMEEHFGLEAEVDIPSADSDQNVSEQREEPTEETGESSEGVDVFDTMRAELEGHRADIMAILSDAESRLTDAERAMAEQFLVRIALALADVARRDDTHVEVVERLLRELQRADTPAQT